MIRNVTRHTVLHEHPVWAKSILRQALGMMFRKPTHEGIIFLFMPARRDVLHMWFVFGPVDVILLDGAGKVIGLRTLKPWRTWNPHTLISCMLELPPGIIARSKTRIGDRIALPQPTSSSIWQWWHYALFFLLHVLIALAVAGMFIVTIGK